MTKEQAITILIQACALAQEKGGVFNLQVASKVCEAILLLENEIKEKQEINEPVESELPVAE